MACCYPTERNSLHLRAGRPRRALSHVGGVEGHVRVCVATKLGCASSEEGRTLRHGEESGRSVARMRGLKVAVIASVGAVVVAAGVVAAPSMLLGAGQTGRVGETSVVATPSTSATTSPVNTVDPVPTKLSPFKKRLLIAARSVGVDIARAAPAAYKAAHLARPKVEAWSKAESSRRPVIATAGIGRNGNTRSKLRAFASLVNDAPRDSVDVAMMAFNYEDVTAETDIVQLFQNYADTMESVEAANPDIIFLYATVPVTSANSWRAVSQESVKGLGIDVDQPVWQDNIARERLNSLIRSEYSKSGRLFDIAAMQARLGKGQVAAKQHEGEYYFVMNPKLSQDGKRLTSSGAKQLADALMRLVTAASRG